MRDNAPRTVTFGASSQDEAQFRSARLGSNVVGWTLGLAAGICALVACVWSVSFAATLGTTWPEVAKLSLVAIAATLALSGLPVAGALLARAYPDEARAAMGLWGGALAVVAIGMAAFVVTLEVPADPLAQSEEAAAEWREAAGITDVVWRYSYQCRQPENEFQERMCDAYRSAPAAGGSWSPAAILPFTAATDGPFRRILVLCLGLLAVAGAGLLGRLSVLAMSESYRLGMGEAAPAQLPSAPGAFAPTAGNIIGPQEAFEMWVEGRLLPDAGGEVMGDDAFQDYTLTCRLNGLQPMSPAKFGSLLGTLADRSGGRISKVRSNGRSRYRGVKLPDGAGMASSGQFSGPDWGH